MKREGDDGEKKDLRDRDAKEELVVEVGLVRGVEEVGRGYVDEGGEDEETELEKVGRAGPCDSPRGEA